ncbi:DUF724 domain-containing protein 1-like [Humulus lupulus]|uniref:DUF724 domain-containing protein 1-like n=1 Tax=Humulus lupulus TaxID=3486 RepID=UPI002B41651B|nr:DUF724 domain-containing protein 1-like [Humulus lupulus]
MEGFTEGSTVEVWSKEDGFQNAWFSAVRHSRTTNPYSHSFSLSRQEEDEAYQKRQLKGRHSISTHARRRRQGASFEKIDRFFVRPTPPPPDTEPDKPFAQNDVVDAFHHDIWWTGVIINVENDNYTVRFAIPSDLLYCNHSQLQPHWDWVDKKWVRSGKQEIKYSKFRPGTGVEVKLSTENEGLNFCSGEV